MANIFKLMTFSKRDTDRFLFVKKEYEDKFGKQSIPSVIRILTNEKYAEIVRESDPESVKERMASIKTAIKNRP